MATMTITKGVYKVHRAFDAASFVVDDVLSAVPPYVPVATFSAEGCETALVYYDGTGFDIDADSVTFEILFYDGRGGVWSRGPQFTAKPRAVTPIDVHGAGTVALRIQAIAVAGAPDDVEVRIAGGLFEDAGR